MLKKILILFITGSYFFTFAQKDTIPYSRKEEIVHDGKRYRKYNNYLTFGFGKAYSSVRPLMQNLINVDLQFHLMREHFQLGFFMSGDDFLRNNNIQGHLCYGYRYEKPKFNLAGFIGPSYSYFVTAKTDTAGNVSPVINSIMGGYACIQAVYKIKYDVGLGLELFGDFSSLQKMAGVKIVFYFSGAYRGIKRGFKTKPKPN